MEINEKWIKYKLTTEEKICIYELILERSPFQLKDEEKVELRQFMESYIRPLSIVDYVMPVEHKKEDGLTTIIRTHDKIGEIHTFRNVVDENKFQCILRLFPINQIYSIEILSFGDSDNLLLIQSVKDENIKLSYRSDNHDAIRFIQSLI